MLSKQISWGGVSFILVLSIFLSACGWTNQQPSNPGSQPSDPGIITPAENPTAAPETAQPSQSQEYTNQEFGYSLNYPNGYEVQSNFNHSITFLAQQGTQGHRERAFIQVELAGDQTAEWFVSQAKEEHANLGIILTSSTMNIAGQPAQILSQVSGQDLTRQVFIVYEGILYRLSFIPDDNQRGEEYQQMETLFAEITSSLRFLPGRTGVPPVTIMYNLIYRLEKALEARSAGDVLGMLGDEFSVGHWVPGEMGSERFGRNEAAPLLIDRYVSQAPDLVFQEQVDWQTLVGGFETFTAFYPNENIHPVLVRGWGPQGSDEAVIIIARRPDGSLYWRGVFAANGPIAK